MIFGVPVWRGFFFVGTPRDPPGPPGTPGTRGSAQAELARFSSMLRYATLRFRFRFALLRFASLRFAFASLRFKFKFEIDNDSLSTNDSNSITIRFRQTTRKIRVPTRRRVGGFIYVYVCNSGGSMSIFGLAGIGRSN